MERGYSKSQLNAVMTALKNTSEENAKAIIDYMDDNGFHPDWSEASWAQLRKHFNMVLSFMSVKA